MDGNRRHFLKQSGLIGLALGLSSVSAFAAHLSGSHAQSDRIQLCYNLCCAKILATGSDVSKDRNQLEMLFDKFSWLIFGRIVLNSRRKFHDFSMSAQTVGVLPMNV